MKFEFARTITTAEFRSLLERSSLAERRPVDNQEALDAMLKHGNLLCTAWDNELLVGVARSLTDFEYSCYLSDLAVDKNYQKRGIGSQLIELTKNQLGKKASLILLSAPAAEGYYPKIGFTKHESAWLIKSDQSMLSNKK